MILHVYIGSPCISGIIIVVKENKQVLILLVVFPLGFRSIFPSGFSQGVPAPRPQHENYPSGAQHPGVYAPQGVPAPWPPHENYPSGAQHPGVYAPPGPRYY